MRFDPTDEAMSQQDNVLPETVLAVPDESNSIENLSQYSPADIGTRQLRVIDDLPPMPEIQPRRSTMNKRSHSQVNNEIATCQHFNSTLLIMGCCYRYRDLSHYREPFHNRLHLQLIYEVSNTNGNFKKNCDNGRTEKRKYIDSSQRAHPPDLIDHFKLKGRPNHSPMHRIWCSIAKYGHWNEKWLKTSGEFNVSLMKQRVERGDG
jgi:hypothetical protein